MAFVIWRSCFSVDCTRVARSTPGSLLVSSRRSSSLVVIWPRFYHLPSMTVGRTIMAKHGLKLSVRIPNFMKDARAWRRAIHEAILKVQDRAKVQYSDEDKLEVE